MDVAPVAGYGLSRPSKPPVYRSAARLRKQFAKVSPVKPAIFLTAAFLLLSFGSRTLADPRIALILGDGIYGNVRNASIGNCAFGTLQ